MEIGKKLVSSPITPEVNKTPQEQPNITQVASEQALPTPLEAAKENTPAELPKQLKLLAEYRVTQQESKEAKEAFKALVAEKDAKLKKEIAALDNDLRQFTERAAQDLKSTTDLESRLFIELKVKNAQEYTKKQRDQKKELKQLENQRNSKNTAATQAEVKVERALKLANSEATKAQYNRFAKEATKLRNAVNEAKEKCKTLKAQHEKNLAALKAEHEKAEADKTKEVEAKKAELQAKHDANLKQKQAMVAAEKAKLTEETAIAKKQSEEAYHAKQGIKHDKLEEIRAYYNGACTPAGERWTRFGSDSEGYADYHNAVAEVKQAIAEGKTPDLATLNTYVELTKLVASKATAKTDAKALGYIIQQSIELYVLTKDERLIEFAYDLWHLALATTFTADQQKVLSSYADYRKLTNLAEQHAEIKNSMATRKDSGTPAASDDSKTINILLSDVNQILSEYGLPHVSHATVKIAVDGLAKVFEEVIASILGKTAPKTAEVAEAQPIAA